MFVNYPNYSTYSQLVCISTGCPLSATSGCGKLGFFLGGGGDSPQWTRASSFVRGFYITINDAPQSVGLLWTSDRLFAETSIWKHTTLTTDIHAPCGIRTQDFSWRTAADLRLIPHGYRSKLGRIIYYESSPISSIGYSIKLKQILYGTSEIE